MQASIKNASAAKHSARTSRATCDSGSSVANRKPAKKAPKSIVTNNSTPTVEMLQEEIEYLNERLINQCRLIDTLEYQVELRQKYESLLEDQIRYLETGNPTRRKHFLRVVE